MINTRSNFGLVKWLEDLTTDIIDTEFYPHVWSHCASRSAHLSKEDDKYLLEIQVPGYNKKKNFNRMLVSEGHAVEYFRGKR